jgi:hypothetical protein
MTRLQVHDQRFTDNMQNELQQQALKGISTIWRILNIKD